MNLRDARYFIVAASCPSFGRAAQRCFLTQQALSAAIVRLEREVGEPLFARHRQGISLTDAGERLLPGARTLVELADRTVASVREAATESDVRSLRVGIMEPAAAELTTPIIQAFRAAHPRVTVSVREISFRGAADAVVSGYVDVALVVGPVGADPRVQHATLFREPRALLVPGGHLLADADAVPTADVVDLTLTFLPGAELAPPWIGFWRLEDLRNGEVPPLAPPLVAEAHTPSEVNEVVAAGVAVVGAPLSHARRFPHDGVSVVRLLGAPGSGVGTLVPARRQSPLAPAFVEVAAKVTNDLIQLVQHAWLGAA